MAGVHLVVPGPQAATLLAHGGRLVLSLNLLGAGVGAGSFGPPGDVRNHAIVRWSSLSEDGGKTWTPWATEPVMSLGTLGAPIFDDASHLLLVDDRRLWTSSDYGRTWHERSLALQQGVHAFGVLAARAGGLVILALRGRGTLGETLLNRSEDGGAHWTAVPLPQEVRPASQAGLWATAQWSPSG